MALVFLGLPKGGSTSFHFLAGGSLGIPSFHVGGGGFLEQLSYEVWSEADRASEAACADHGLVRASVLPAYDEALHVLGDDHVYCMLHSSGYRAFADDPWPLLWPYIDSVANDTKFVLWERDPAEWAASAVHFFEDDGNWKWLRFFYGACNMTAKYQWHLERVARAHYASIRSYFLGVDAPPERRARLLLVDYTDPLAGKRICEFSQGVGAALCADLDRMPRSMPSALLMGEDADAVKMPLGRPSELPAFQACLSPGGAFSRSVGSAAQRGAHLAAAARIARRMEAAFGGRGRQNETAQPAV